MDMSGERMSKGKRYRSPYTKSLSEGPTDNL
jgi:hypothetical protein